MTTFSEPAINAMLAEVLSKRGLLGASETVVRRKGETRKPDVLMLINGVKVILEGKLEKASARDELERQCTQRIKEGLCDVSLGVVYKLVRYDKLFLSNEDLKAMLNESRFDVRIWIPSTNTAEATINWTEVDLDGLARLVRSAINEVASKDILDEAVKILRDALQKATNEFVEGTSKPTLNNTAEKLATIIEVTKPKDDDERVRTIEMSLLVLVDAAIFYNVAAPANKLDTLDELKSSKRSWSSALKVGFEEILEINYEPVFDLALKILDAIPTLGEETLNIIVDVSKYISASKALLKHDLMGRIYHKLLFQDIAKHLATFYTSVPAAWVLARVAFEGNRIPWRNFDWTDPNEVRKLRICDMACGSGTLLSAIYRSVEDRYVITCSSNDVDADFQKLHENLMEHTIYGFDVMTYAAHIATLTLALHSPDNIFRKSNIFVMPLGGDGRQLGSVNFLRRGEHAVKTRSLRGDMTGPIRMGVDKREVESLKLEPQTFDVIIMNPPFARTSGDNLMFGSVEDKKIRGAMKVELSSTLQELGFSGIGQAGLGAVFVLLADKFTKIGGIIAFVLPRNLLSGVSWEKIRELLAERIDKNQWERGGYHLEHVMLSAEPGSYNFSENTDLSECMFVARKLKANEEPGKTTVVIFHKKPKTVFESLIVARQLTQHHEASQSSDVFDILSNPNAWPEELNIGNESVGKLYSLEAESLRENTDNWGRLVAFANPELTKIVHSLATLGELSVPRGVSLEIPLTDLGDIATVGPDRKQVHNGFNVLDKGGILDALWGRKMTMNTVKIAPNARLAAKSGQKVNSLLETASQWLVAERLWLDTTPLVSVFCSKPVLSNVWWLIQPREYQKLKIEDIPKILTLWTNSTPGLLVYLSELEVTRGGWVGMKKAPLQKMKTLDIEELDSRQMDQLLDLYEEVKSDQVPLLKEQFEEASNGRGWRVKLDTKLLGIITKRQVKYKELATLYDLLKAESAHWQMPSKAE